MSQRIMCGLARHGSSLPSAPQDVATPVPAPRGSLSLAQQLFCLATSISPVTSAATAVKHELRRRKLVSCPASFREAGLWSVGGMQAVHSQHASSPWQVLLWALPMCKSHEVGYSDLKMEDGSGNQPVVWWNKSQRCFL